MIRRELLILALISAPLICGEVFLRVSGSTISQNIRTITQIPAQADDLQQAPRNDRALILGNSMTLRGLSPKGISDEFQDRTGREFTGQLIAMNGAYIAEWEWLLKNHFLRTSKMPTHLFLNCSPKGLADGIGITRRRIALISRWDDRYPYIPGNHALPSFGHKCEFVLSGSSVLFSRARAIGGVAVEKIIPNHSVGADWVNRDLVSRNRTPQSPPKEPYVSLRTLIEDCGQGGTRVHVVLMPRQSIIPMPLELEYLLRNSGVSLIDFQNTLKWEPSDFRDGAHLSEAGRAKFTPIYTQAIIDAMSSDDDRAL
jgi:hypothetical protein